MPYYKQSAVVEARQFLSEVTDELFLWLANHGAHITYKGLLKRQLILSSPGGNMVVYPNDWIVRYLEGGFEVLSPDAFHTYHTEMSDLTNSVGPGEEVASSSAFTWERQKDGTITTDRELSDDDMKKLIGTYLALGQLIDTEMLLEMLEREG